LNGSTTKVGEDIFFQVKNQSGATIPKGTAVRFDGVVGASGRIKIVPFLANGSNPSIYFLGVTYESIADGADGKALFNGKIRGVNTSAFTVGDILYASPTVAGGFTTTKPVAPNNIISVAAVLSSGANGILLIRPQIGSNINNDEGVKITSPTTGDLLQLQASGLWENKTKAQILNGTSLQFVKGDGSLDSTSYQPLLTNPITGSIATGQVAFGTAAGVIGGDAGLFWDNENKRLGVGTIIPSAKIQLNTNLAEDLFSIINPSSDQTRRFLIKTIDEGRGTQVLITNRNSTASLLVGSNSGSNVNGIGLLRLDQEYGIGGIGNSTAIRTKGNLVPEQNNVNDLGRTNRFYRSGFFATSVVSLGHILINTTTNAGFRLDVNGTARIVGATRIDNLAGTGTRMVVADANGVMSTQALGIAGSGTLNRLAKFTAGGTVGDSAIFENGGNVGIGTDSPTDFGNGYRTLELSGTTGGGVFRSSSNSVITDMYSDASAGVSVINVRNNNPLTFLVNSNERMRITSGGNILINTTTDAGFKLDVNGSLRANTRVNFAVLPTSSSGLVSGDLWINGTVINIIP
jgi:hypothetical protein